MKTDLQTLSQSDGHDDGAVDAEVIDGGIADPEVPVQFTVHDEATANWVLRRIKECRAYKKWVKEFAAKEAARADHEEQFFLFRYGRQLEAWASGKIAEFNGRRKSVRLPAGVLAFRHENARLVIDDEQAVLQWARINCPVAVQVIERLSKSLLSEHFATTGQLPEVGAHVESERECFRLS